MVVNDDKLVKVRVTPESDPNTSNLPANTEAECNEVIRDQIKELIQNLVQEKDPDKSRDLTGLFNEAQKKKNMLQIAKIDELYDMGLDQLYDRMKKRPDSMALEDLLKTLSMLQTAMEKKQKYVAGINEQGPLIQVNSQEIHVTNDDPTQVLDKASRDRVRAALDALLKGSAAAETNQVVDEQQVVDVSVNKPEETNND